MPPAPAKNSGNKVPCSKPKIWVKLGDTWIPWYVPPTADWLPTDWMNSLGNHVW